MDDVARPKQAALMRDAVKPVVGKVVGEEEEGPHPPVPGVEAKRGQLIKEDEDSEDRELDPCRDPPDA